MSYFSKFDICEAYYVFATNYHGGQWSPTYRILGRLEAIGFRPACGLKLECLEGNALEIYEDLVQRHGFITVPDDGSLDEHLAGMHEVTE